MIDLRSDTVTRPSPEMRRAMADAEVGDDVIDIDPTVERLQQLGAELLGKEAAIYMPSGTMTNQIAIRVHCRPGDEFICDENCHILNYEQGAFAQLSGVVAKTVPSEFGILRLEQLTGLIRDINEHMVVTRMVSLENTHNRGAGGIQPIENVRQISQWAREHNLAMHLDGARLFNAVVASGIAASEWASHFDTISICLSKGLGAPVGSLLAGPKDLIAQARRHRKLFGGGMRQAGIIAAGGLYALQNNIERLAEDHEKVQILASAIDAAPGLTPLPERFDTNIAIFGIAPSLGTAQWFVDELEKSNIQCFPFSPTSVRLVTHMDVSFEEVETAARVLVEIAQRAAGCT